MAKQTVTVIGRFTFIVDLGDFTMKDFIALLNDPNNDCNVWEVGTGLSEEWEEEGGD